MLLSAWWRLGETEPSCYFFGENGGCIPQAQNYFLADGMAWALIYDDGRADRDRWQAVAADAWQKSEAEPWGPDYPKSTFLTVKTHMMHANNGVAWMRYAQEYLAVWYNDRAGNDDIRAQRIARDGRLLGSRFYVAAGAGADRRHPDVAYDSQSHEYLVVWEHYDQASHSYWIKGQRVSGTGALLGGTINIFNSGVSSRAPAVAYASTANQYLIVWSWDSGGLMHIVGKAYSSGGSLGPMFYIFKDTVGSLRERPDLAYNRARNEFLVVWEEFTAGTMDIYGARVKMNGGAGVLGAPIAIATSGADKRNPAVAAVPQPAGAGRYMVAWEYYNAAGDVDNLGQIMKGDGTFGPALALAYSAWNESAPALAGSEDRGEFLATWTFESTTAPPGMMQVNGLTVSWDGWGVGPIMTVGGGQVHNSAVREPYLFTHRLQVMALPQLALVYLKPN